MKVEVSTCTWEVKSLTKEIETLSKTEMEGLEELKKA